MRRHIATELLTANALTFSNTNDLRFGFRIHDVGQYLVARARTHAYFDYYMLKITMTNSEMRN